MGLTELLDPAELQALLLESLIDNTYPILAIAVLFGAIGLPMPTSMVVLAAGAFAAQGLVGLPGVIFTTFFFATLGDSTGFGFGKWLSVNRGRLPVRIDSLLQFKGIGFDEHSHSIIFTSRFIFTGIGSPVNVLSGLKKTSYPTFFRYAASGELIWSLEMSLLGFFLGAHLDELYGFISDFSFAAVLLLAVLWLGKRAL